MIVAWISRDDRYYVWRIISILSAGLMLTEFGKWCLRWHKIPFLDVIKYKIVLYERQYFCNINMFILHFKITRNCWISYDFLISFLLDGILHLVSVVHRVGGDVLKRRLKTIFVEDILLYKLHITFWLINSCQFGVVLDWYGIIAVLDALLYVYGKS